MKKDFIPIIKGEEKLVEKAAQKRSAAETRYPLVYGLFATFGFVSTLYGFEKLIDKVDLFVDNPWILLATGVTTLLLTGTAYRKLS
jgi:hypothetical protein